MIIVELLCETAVADKILKAAARHLLNAVDKGYTNQQAVLDSMFEDEFIDTFEESETRKRGFRTKLRDWCSNSVHAMGYELEFKFQNGRLPIWRMITAPTTWKPDPKRHPGRFWSWDRDAAEAHWGRQDKTEVEWLLHTTVTTDQINWPVTISKNCMPDYEDEKEIELKPVPITILSYERVA